VQADLVALDEALDQLAQVDRQAAQVVELRFFADQTHAEVAEVLGISERGVRRSFSFAKAWLYRYLQEHTDDGLSGGEGSFNMCTFWLVEALTRAGRADPSRLEAARLMFEQMLTYANHLGLYAEETGPSGEALGNFPQAFTHLGLISAAYNLDRALDGR